MAEEIKVRTRQIGRDLMHRLFGEFAFSKPLYGRLSTTGWLKYTAPYRTYAYSITEGHPLNPLNREVALVIGSYVNGSGIYTDDPVILNNIREFREGLAIDESTFGPTFEVSLIEQEDGSIELTE